MSKGLMTIEQMQAALPKQMKKTISQELVDHINGVFTNTEDREYYRDNILSYASVLGDGKFKMDNYLNAVRYVGFKVRGDTNIAAYTKTFPDKFAKFKADGVSDKDISSYVVAYNKSKLVNLILAETLVPTHILNADLHQAALNKQYQLMNTAASEKVQMEAANSLLTHLKPPETKKMELEVTQTESKSVQDLRSTMLDLVRQQKDMLQKGQINAQDAAHSRLVVDGECEEIVG